MRNQAFLLAACAAVVIGCGGGGHKGGSKSGTTGTPVATEGMTVDLGQNATYGRVEVSYLTGEGRATGDTYLEIVRQRIQNGDGVDVFDRTDGSSPINLRLPGFQTLSTGIDVAFGSQFGRFNSQRLSQITFDPSRVLVEQADQSLVEASLPVPTSTNLPNNPEFTLPAKLDARITAFPGRNSLVQLRVSTATFYIDPTLGTYVFNQARFQALNNSTTGTDPSAVGTVASRLSDFVRFPLASLPANEVPALQTSFDGGATNNNGRFVYFSGDNTAISSAASGGVFQEIGADFNQIVLGTWADKSGAFQGTYTLNDADPVDVNGDPRRFVAMYGSFRDYTEVLTGGSSFEIVMFPNSGEQYDDERQGDIVGIVREGGAITHMYFGGVSLESGTFSLLPIFYLGADPAFGGDANHPSVESARVTGKVSGYVDSSGTTTTNFAAVRRLKFAFDSTVPTGGTATGNRDRVPQVAHRVNSILCGLDTEYGLLLGGRGAEEQIEDATAFVRASPDGRFVGWDYRPESPRSDLRGFRLEALAFDPVDAQFDTGKSHGAPHEIRADRVLANGARLYNDHGHPEYATPECRSVWEIALQDRAGEGFMLRAAAALADTTGLDVRVYKNNTDFHGASYGTHESYLVPRALGFQRLFDACVPMLVARQLLVGAGKVGSETGVWVDYQLSQRADFFVEAANAETLYRRPVFNTRDEPHAEASRWIRLHVIAGDANMIPAATARKAGLLKLALALAEAGEPPQFKLADPVRAFMDVSRDATRRRFEIKLAGGSWTTADEILEGYFAAAQARLDLDEDARWTIDSSRRLLGQMRTDESAFRREVDWAAKRFILDQADLDYKDPALRAYDLEYSNPDPEEGLHSALEDMGEVDPGPGVEDRGERVREGTRARARSVAVRRFAGELQSASWRTLVFKNGAEIDLEPDVDYPETLEAIDDVGTFIEALRGLQKDHD